MSAIDSNCSQITPKPFDRHGYIKSPTTDFFVEARELHQKGLIGENSLIGFGRNESSINFWSEKGHSQWQAYKQDGSSAALLAADYHKQMVSERQELATSYLSDVMRLAKDFNQLDLPKISFHQVQNNVQEGKPLASGLQVSHQSEIRAIEQFWQDNKNRINQLEDSLKKLETFPKDLEGWLQQQSFPISDEVHQVVDRLKNAWADMGKVEVDSEYRPNGVVFQVTLEEDETNASSSPSNITTDQANHNLSMIRSVEQIALQGAQTHFRSFNDKDDLIGIAGQELLTQHLKNTYQEMQTLSKELYSDFAYQFGQNSGHADYSLQDMVDNYLSDKPLAQLDDGTLHPNEKEIKAFWQENRLALEQYSAKQRQLNELPKDLSSYFSQNKAMIEQYLMENLDRFLTMEIELDR